MVEYVDPDDIAPYPCQTCKHRFSSRYRLAYHRCDPRGTKPRRVGNNRRKLTAAQVLAIRKEYAEGVIQAELSRRYLVAPGTIRRIVQRELWKHI